MVVFFRSKIIVIVCSVIGGLVLIGIIIVIIICNMSKRAKSAEETTRIAALMHGVDEGLVSVQVNEGKRG